MPTRKQGDAQPTALVAALARTAPTPRERGGAGLLVLAHRLTDTKPLEGNCSVRMWLPRSRSSPRAAAGTGQAPAASPACLVV